MTSSPEPEEVPVWKCGDPLKFPLPKPEADPWDVVLQPLLEKDNEQCEAWKAEVETLLIFAGLFSAVVTGFVVDSYKALQPDSNQEIITLLSRIANRLDNPLSATSVAQLPVLAIISQSPPSAISRVNILWFISLVLSLTTVLVGTIGLQWLREHRRYPNCTSKDKFAILNMRSEGLKEWYVPQVFLMLPVALQLAVVLFLVGLIDFLPTVAPSKVSIPIIASIGIPIMFIFLTTIIPSCHWIPSTIFFRIFKQKVPSQCPYKSPQSSLCIGISTWILPVCEQVLKLVYLRTNMINADRFSSWRLALDNLIERLPHQGNLAALGYREHCHEEIYKAQWLEDLQLHSDLQVCANNWSEYAKLDLKAPLYDCIAGLNIINIENDLKLPIEAASYYCIQDLFQHQNQRNIFSNAVAWYQYLQRMLHKNHLHNSLSSRLDKCTRASLNIEILQEETLVIALLLSKRSKRNPESKLAVSEHYMRIMQYYSAKPTGRGGNLSEAIYTLADKREATGNAADRCLLSEQYTKLLEKLLRDLVFEYTTEIHDYLETVNFVEAAFAIQNYASKISTLQVIENHILKYYLSEPHISETPQYLMYLVLGSYVGSIFWFCSGDSKEEEKLCAAAKPLARSLGQIGNKIKFSQLEREPYDFGFGYEVFKLKNDSSEEGGEGTSGGSPPDEGGSMENTSPFPFQHGLPGTMESSQSEYDSAHAKEEEEEEEDHSTLRRSLTKEIDQV